MLHSLDSQVPLFTATSASSYYLAEPTVTAQPAPPSWPHEDLGNYGRGCSQLAAALVCETPLAQKGHQAIMNLRRAQPDCAFAMAKMGVAQCPDSAVLRNDLLVLADARDVEIESKLLGDIARGLVQPTACAFNVCINRAVTTGRHVDALTYLVGLHISGFVADRYTHRALAPLFLQLERTASRGVQPLIDYSRRQSSRDTMPGCSAQIRETDTIALHISEIKKKLQALLASPAALAETIKWYWLPCNHTLWDGSFRRAFFDTMVTQASAESALAAYHDLAMHGGISMPSDVLRLTQRWRSLRTSQSPTPASAERRGLQAAPRRRPLGRRRR